MPNTTNPKIMVVLKLVWADNIGNYEKLNNIL